MRLLLTLLTLCFASEAYALSCMRPNIARSFNWLHEDDKTYHVVHGVIGAMKAPKNRKDGQLVKAEFRGNVFGQTATKTFPVTIRIGCSGPWCGNVPTFDGPRAMFFEKTQAGYVFNASACGGPVFNMRKNDAFGLIKSCVRRGKCSDSDIAQFER